jgi:hypothetical protein
MATVIELTPEHHSKLQAVAAARGQVDLSVIINEAVDRYLQDCALTSADAKDLDPFDRYFGTISDEEGERLLADVRQLRQQWR